MVAGMSAILAPPPASHRPWRSPLPTAWAGGAILGLTGLLLAAGVLLAVRRATGWFVHEPAAFEAISAAAAPGLAVWGSRTLWRRLGIESRRGALFVAWGGSVALALLAAACVLPALRNVDLVMWLPLVVADQFWRQRFLEETGAPVASPGGVCEAESDYRPALGQHSVDRARLLPPSEGGESELVLQELFRVRDAGGVESIYGSLRVPFVAGQRHAIVHVGFCPPLVRLPAIEADPCDGPDAEVKVLQTLAHGARLEVRLAEPAPGTCVATIEFAARPGQ